MTLNASKCHLLVSGFKDGAMCGKVGDLVGGGRRQNSLDYYDAFSYPSLVVI